MIEDQSLRLDVVIIAALVLMAMTIIIILFFKESTKSLAEGSKEYCDIHPDDTDRCMCEDRLFESENQRYHWQVCQDMIQYVEDQDCDIFYEISTCIKARKKTISDLNCTELRDYFENGRQCEGLSPFMVCKYPQSYEGSSGASKPHLLYHMILRNC